MKQIALSNGITASAVIVGLMRIQELSDEQIRELVASARANGIDFFDHADAYGSHYHGCEERFGEAVTFSSSEREQVILQTKCGIREGQWDFSAKHIVEAANGSLKALRTDYLDVLLLHRPDALVEPEEVADAFDQLQRAGKVRHFGVSNHTPNQIELLKRYVKQPLAINQLQLSITHAALFDSGLAMNMKDYEPSVQRDHDIVDYCRLHDITIQAWSPFQKGFFDGVFLGDPNLGELNAVIDELAETHGVSPEGIAVAWIARHPARMQIVLGTTKPARVAACAAGADVVLSREEWYRLYIAGGGRLV